MRPLNHIAAIIFGLAAPAAVTFWSVSATGPRNAEHYARVAAENPTTRSVIEGFEARAIDGRDPAGAIRDLFAEDMIEHDQAVAGTRQSVIDYLEGRGWSGTTPQRTIHRIIVDGEYAAVHHRVQLQPDEPGLAVVDIFRVVDGKVVEHWDVMQPIAADSPNVHGPF